MYFAKWLHWPLFTFSLICALALMMQRVEPPLAEPTISSTSDSAILSIATDVDTLRRQTLSLNADANESAARSLNKAQTRYMRRLEKATDAEATVVVAPETLALSNALRKTLDQIQSILSIHNEQRDALYQMQLAARDAELALEASTSQGRTAQLSVMKNSLSLVRELNHQHKPSQTQALATRLKRHQTHSSLSELAEAKDKVQSFYAVAIKTAQLPAKLHDANTELNEIMILPLIHDYTRHALSPTTNEAPYRPTVSTVAGLWCIAIACWLFFTGCGLQRRVRIPSAVLNERPAILDPERADDIQAPPEIQQNIATAESDDKDASEEAASCPPPSQEDIDTAYLKAYHQIASPLHHLERNVQNLQEVADQLHQAVDFPPNSPAIKKLPADLACLISSGSLTELPFTLAETHDSVQALRNVSDGLQSSLMSAPSPVEALDLHHVIKRVVRRIKHSVSSDLDLRVSLANTAPEITANPADIEHALDAILSTSISAAERDNDEGQIEIRTTVHENTVKLLVRDNGKPLERAALQSILSPYHNDGRGETLSLDERSSALARAARSLENIGGKLEVLAKAGEGSSVRVTLHCNQAVYSDENGKMDHHNKRRVCDLHVDTAINKIVKAAAPTIRSVAKLRLNINTLGLTLRCIPVELATALNAMLSQAATAQKQSIIPNRFIEVSCETQGHVMQLSVLDNALPGGSRKNAEGLTKWRRQSSRDALVKIKSVLQQYGGHVEFKCAKTGGACLTAHWPIDPALAANHCPKEAPEVATSETETPGNIVALHTVETAAVSDEDDIRFDDSGVVADPHARRLTLL